MSIESITYPTVRNGPGSVDKFLDIIDSSRIRDSVGRSTMQFAPQPDIPSSPVNDVVQEMMAARSRGVDAYIAIDNDYVQNMTRIGDRDYPDYMPLLSKADRKERRVNQAAARIVLTNLRNNGMLRESGVILTQRDYTPRLRDIASLHVAQLMAVKHAKEGHFVPEYGEPIAWIDSANFTDSDLTRMNNLSFEVTGDLARFVIGSMKNGFGHTAGRQRCVRGNVAVLHDFNNRGEPGNHSGIIEEALITIDPRMGELIDTPTKETAKTPTHILYGSQYLPDGRMFKALQNAKKHSEVHVSHQPAGDHRVEAFPYNLHSAYYGWRMDRSGIARINRDEGSHLKIIVAKYDDDSARILGSTDNFLVHLQKFLRNEELAVVVDLDLKRDDDRQYFEDVISLLSSMGELSDEARSDFLAK